MGMPCQKLVELVTAYLDDALPSAQRACCDEHLRTYVGCRVDFTDDLKKIGVPTLIMHGDDDQVVPIGASAMLSSKLVKHAQLKVYQGSIMTCARRTVT
jgi:pimeloyl-ACP methyl ester carboxylesterase